MPQPAVLDVGTGIRPFALARLEKELETALQFHEERLAHDPQPDDVAIAIHRRSQTARDEILAAMSRVIEETYGMCETCQMPISDHRLEAMPHARHCIQCAQRVV